ncbi:UNVERIFIED_CONTAM: hypothetical protein Scaly_1777900 [Sesamum calycinum]|uniref:Uncharacterized protein n=1 Tax=Sesamum calycinum TaxID=2727403 RepID=A0AAW2NYA1_9LAMI
MSLEDIVKSLALSTLQFHQDMKASLQETKASLQNLGNQHSQLATSVSQLETQTSKELSSQMEANPMVNETVVTLQSEKELHRNEQAPMGAKEDEKSLEDIETHNKKIESDLITLPSFNTCALAFPYRMPKSKDDEKEIPNTSNKVGKNVLFYKFRLKLIPDKLSSSWLGRFECVNIFPHGVARIKSLDMGQTFKVNGHRSKPFLSGDEATTIIGIALASFQQLTH